MCFLCNPCHKSFPLACSNVKAVWVNKFLIPAAVKGRLQYVFPVCCTSHRAVSLFSWVKWKRCNINFIWKNTSFSTCSQHLFISSEHFCVVLKQSLEINCAVYYSWTHAMQHEAHYKHSFKTKKLDLFCFRRWPFPFGCARLQFTFQKTAFMDY